MFKITELLQATRGKTLADRSAVATGQVSTDTRTLGKGDIFIAIKGDNFDGHNFIDKAIKKGASVIIVHKNVRIKRKDVCIIKVKDTTKALGDIAHFHRLKFDIPFIAVTGSNGKTTTKEMIASVLERKGKVLKNPGTHNNHIGLPQTILKLDGSYKFAVVELGTNHPGEIGYLSRICRPDIAIITNIAASHLEYFKDLKGVLKEKYSIAGNLNKNGLLIMNADDQRLSGKFRPNGPFKLGFGIKNKTDFQAGSVKTGGLQTRFVVNAKYSFALGTPGHYNIYNALAAITCGRLFGLSYKELSVCLSGFVFPKGRLNMLEINGADFIDDTYNSNPYSLSQALEVLNAFDAKGRRIFVMGDMMELGENSHQFHSRAIESAFTFCDHLITVGPLSKKAAKVSEKKNKGNCRVSLAQDSIEAKIILKENISPGKGDIVLVKGSRRMLMEEVLKI